MRQIEVICETCAGRGFFDEFSHTNGHYTRDCEDCKGEGRHELIVHETESRVSTASTEYVLMFKGLPGVAHQFFVEWLYEAFHKQTIARTSDDIYEAHVFSHYEDALVEFNESMRHKHSDAFQPIIVRVAREHIAQVRIVPIDEAMRDDDEADLKAELEAATPLPRNDCN